MSMKKRITLTLAGLTLLVGILGGIKGLQIDRMIAHGKQMLPPSEAVTTAVAILQTWESLLPAVGSLAAVQGVTVTAELTGKVVQIAFTPGSRVKAGDMLVKQDTSSEEAQLRSAEAAAALAKLNVERLGKLLAERTISQSEYDNAEAGYKQAVAQADNIRATIAKKTIRAPFSGRLGIRQVNLGQMLREGDPIVTLQSLDPIYVDFTLPQQQLPGSSAGLPVRVTTDALPGETLQGRITAINPLVDAETRKIKVQATVANRREQAPPRHVRQRCGGASRPRQKVLAIPATAVLYAPYGDSVFIVEDAEANQEGKVLRQQFVRLGEKRGDFVAVTAGSRRGRRSSAPASSSCATASQWWSTTDWPLTSEQTPKPRKN